MFLQSETAICVITKSKIETSCPNLRIDPVLLKVKFPRTGPIPPWCFPMPTQPSSPRARLKSPFHQTPLPFLTLEHFCTAHHLDWLTKSRHDQAWFRQSREQDPFHRLWTSPWATATPREVFAFCLK